MSACPRSESLSKGDLGMTAPQQPHGRLRCPKCHGPVYIANVDDVDTILCMDDGCRWKMQVVEEQPPAPAVDALQVLDDIWKFCLINGAEEHGDLIGAPSKDGFFTLKLLKKLAETRAALRQRGRE